MTCVISMWVLRNNWRRREIGFARFPSLSPSARMVEELVRVFPGSVAVRCLAEEQKFEKLWECGDSRSVVTFSSV